LTTFTSVIFRPARQQVVGDGVLDQVHRPALDVGEARAVLQHDAVVAVGVVADHDDGCVLAGRGGDGERVHVGGHHAVQLAGGVLVQALDVVVDLHELDLHAVLVRPLLQDPGLLGVGPGHPAGVDGPADGVFLGCAGRGGGRGLGVGLGVAAGQRQARRRRDCHDLEG
jgi:hypothetical protein